LSRIPDLAGAFDDLAHEGILTRDGERFRTTRRWQGAMARAAFELQATDEEFDLRRPIAMALVSLFGDRCDDRDLARYVAALVTIESPASAMAH